MEYISVKEAAAKWELSERRVRLLCSEGKVHGTIRQGRAFQIPSDAPKPYDGRHTRHRNIPGRYAEMFAAIDSLKEELDRKRPLTAEELERLQKEFMVEYTFNSNAIEGNTLTLQETALALEGVTIDKKPLKDHLEAVGHRDAFLYVCNLVKEKEPFSQRIIKEIHSLVLMDRPADRGVFRRIPVKIMGAFHEPEPPYLIQEKLDELFADLRKSRRHPIEIATLFHLRFEGIHPFIDGNGRTGRLLLNLYLMQHGYPPIDIKYTDRRQYYSAFDGYYRDKDEGAAMVNIIAGYVKERLERYMLLVRQAEAGL